MNTTELSSKDISESFYNFILTQLKGTTQCVLAHDPIAMHRIIADINSYLKYIKDVKSEYTAAQAALEQAARINNHANLTPQELNTIMELSVEARSQIMSALHKLNVVFSKTTSLNTDRITYAKP